MMKPLLIIPPAPTRWPALGELLSHLGPRWAADLEQRLTQSVARAQDAYAVIPDSGPPVAAACINKCGDVGVLAHCYTHPEHRRRGYARKLMETLLSWFDMTGGKWLFLSTTSELDQGLYRKFGFLPLRRAVWEPYDRLTMVRPGRNVPEYDGGATGGDVAVRDLTRAEWPAMVALLQYQLGPDPRVPLDESAVSAEVFALDLCDHQERGACQLKGAFQGARLVGLATIATDRAGERTYALLMPHTDAPAALREATLEFARGKGYAHVDFPMEGLGKAVAGGLAGPTPEPMTEPPESPLP